MNKLLQSSNVASSIKEAQTKAPENIVMKQEQDEEGSVFSRDTHEHEDLEFHDPDDMKDEDIDETKPEVKERNFEFTSGDDMMRFLRMVFYIQIIALAIDNPTILLPPLFKIAIKGLCFYSLKFYYRPFLDLIYLIQYAYSNLLPLLIQYLPFLNELNSFSNWVINTNVPYENNIKVPRRLVDATFSVNVDYEHNWHSMKYFTQFFLAILFVVMAVLYTFGLWEIKDYTDTHEVQRWLKAYVADGWYRRGGLNLAYCITKGFIAMSLFVLILWSISNQLASPASVPTMSMLSLSMALYLSVLSILWFIGYRALKATEGAFIRYVSQNVAYTSAIILKRVVKSKLETGIVLMFLLYMPALYVFMQSIIIITDWNDTIAMGHRRGVNYYVPCYFMAFPPYRHTHLPENNCPVANSVDSLWVEQNPNHSGMESMVLIFSVHIFIFII